MRVLDAVARTGSVGRAADMLHLTGPAVSQQLRRIEAEAGAKVVVPDGRGVRLTSEGRILARYAGKIAALMQQADNDLHHRDELVARLCIGALASMIRGTLAPSLAAFQRDHPRVELQIEDGETSQHLDRLTGGRLDLVVAESWSPAPLHLPPGVAARRLTRESVRVTLPEQHPLAKKVRLDLADLDGESWATCARNSDGHVALVQIARQSGIELDIRHFVADHATQLALVENGLAVACLPVPGRAPTTPGIVYRQLVPGMHRDTLLVERDGTGSRALEALTTVLSGRGGAGR